MPAQAEFESVRREMEKEAVRAKRLEDRLRVVTKGYVSREEALRADIAALWEAAQTAEQVGGAAPYLGCSDRPPSR